MEFVYCNRRGQPCVIIPQAYITVELHVEPIEFWEQEVQHYAQKKKGNGLEVFFPASIAVFIGQFAWAGENCFGGGQEAAFEMGYEMNGFFGNMKNGFIMFGINFFATLVAIFSGKGITTGLAGLVRGKHR